MANQKKIRENIPSRRWPGQRGAPREGTALLHGLALCGRCGRRMRVRYAGRYNRSYNACENGPWRDLDAAEARWRRWQCSSMLAPEVACFTLLPASLNLLVHVLAPCEPSVCSPRLRR